ncbi:MAG: signal peptidase I [Bryobacteraceae bacterium]|jgi:signal peptidase I
MASAEVTPAVPPPAPPLRAVLYWMRDLALSVVIAVMVILFLYQPVKVEGTSMMPALVDQERIFINKFIYHSLWSIERGDMVVFWYPRDPSKSYIKRVIGIPGDRVAIERGTVIVNGARLQEAYVPPEYHDQQSMAAMVVQPDEYFVLGDHRSSSNDSRAWGTVPRHYIYGKAVFVYWPLDKLGLLK